ncbi:MAG: lipoprotein NlpD [Lentisphaeria bacterium]|jgi:lipoprotein NlpD
MLHFLNKSSTRLSNILITLFLVASCAQSPNSAPVVDKSQPPSKQLTQHVVAKGETLYSIAWRYNLNYQKFASANGLGDSYTIYPGQKLVLKEAALTQSTSSVVVSPKVKESPKIRESARSRSIKETQKAEKKLVTVIKGKPTDWVWPTKGKLTNTFSTNNGLHKGVDIQGKLEEPVIAASSGIVVYSGDGLRGYGKLVIVKHSEKFLSAYAHNKRLLVKEGAEVARGQKIALMGSSGTDRVKLHFEIRLDGKPVDPLIYLPKK